jgi:hypothetical protein
MGATYYRASIETDGWALVSAEERHAAYPESFEIPSKASREALLPGVGVKLLFDIETRENGRVVDRGIDRMWVIVKRRGPQGYEGVLDNNPGRSENLKLGEGDTVHFGPEHVAGIEYPPRHYVVAKYGSSFFDEPSHGV